MFGSQGECSNAVKEKSFIAQVVLKRLEIETGVGWLAEIFICLIFRVRNTHFVLTAYVHCETVKTTSNNQKYFCKTLVVLTFRSHCTSRVFTASITRYKQLFPKTEYSTLWYFFMMACLHCCEGSFKLLNRFFVMTTWIASLPESLRESKSKQNTRDSFVTLA